MFVLLPANNEDSNTCTVRMDATPSVRKILLYFHARDVRISQELCRATKSSALVISPSENGASEEAASDGETTPSTDQCDAQTEDWVSKFHLETVHFDAVTLQMHNHRRFLSRECDFSGFFGGISQNSLKTLKTPQLRDTPQSPWGCVGIRGTKSRGQVVHSRPLFLLFLPRPVLTSF